MIRIKRFQRTLIILLAAINSLLYSSSRPNSLPNILSDTFVFTGIVALTVFTYVSIQNSSRRKKAKLKSQKSLISCTFLVPKLTFLGIFGQLEEYLWVNYQFYLR
jgi:hypothetical protein